MSLRIRRRGRFNRIAFRIFAFNALLAFLPVAAFLLLDTYERGLVDSLEHALVQQARVTAAWLGQTAVVDATAKGAAAAKGAGRIDPDAARAVLAAIGDRRTARFRIVDTQGRLLADSSDSESALAAAATAADSAAGAGVAAVAATGPAKAESGEPFLYRIFSAPTRTWRKYFAPPSPALSSADYYASSGSILLGSEVEDALAGRYGAASRMSSGGQVSVTLYSAVPVYAAEGSVVGAVLLSQSTYRILRDLYAIRLDIAWIFLWNLAAAAALSVLLAFTIVTPLRKLGAAAARSTVAAAFPETSRGDEIGDLQRSLRGLVLRLDQRMRQLERFAADAAHEFRNPLASIRSAAELAEGAEDKAARSRFHRAIIDDAERLRATVDGLRRLSLAEAGAQSGERAQVAAVAAARVACESLRLRLTVGGASSHLAFTVRGDEALEAGVDPAALDVMLGNLLDNASSFAKTEVSVSVSANASFVVFAVDDDGPGIPAEHLDRVFDRFFTWRPDERRGAHTGLGLSLVKALAESGGGSVLAENRPGGGARLTLSLPR